jgi:pantoate--beta-alanine ligase
MGSLHDGHLALVKAARARAERVVATLFVNPTQFGPNEDFAAYPRDEVRDSALLAATGADALYAPNVDVMYPAGFVTSVRVAGLSEVLDGAHRPGHFDGVATVVSKLFAQARPDLAFFGEKDWQQLTLIRRMVRDLDTPVEIVGVPTVREPDGLAMSSRNAYLTPAERAIAPWLNRALVAVADRIRKGGIPEAECAWAEAEIIARGFRSVDYVSLRDPDTLEPMAVLDRPGRLLVAAHLGRARLIDNISV